MGKGPSGPGGAPKGVCGSHRSRGPPWTSGTPSQIPGTPTSAQASLCPSYPAVATLGLVGRMEHGACGPKTDSSRWLEAARWANQLLSRRGGGRRASLRSLLGHVPTSEQGQALAPPP